MLKSFILILLIGFFVGQFARRLKIPALVGMVLVGIILGPQAADLIDPKVLAASAPLRTIAVMVILMKAGLGLDRDKLVQQGTVALRLGFLPATCEALIVALAAMWIFKFDFATGLLLGCIVGAESPAVIVPGMLRLKSLGWGVNKGIPDAILTGSALSDVLLLLVFSLLLNFLTQGTSSGVELPFGLEINAFILLPIQVVVQVGLGIIIGFITAKLLVLLLTKQQWTQNTVQDTLVTATLALLLVVLAEILPVFSGYLAVMVAGFFIIEFDAPLARKLRSGFDSLWTVAQIILFVLLGASIQIQVLENILVPGLIILAVGTLIGRALGWYLSTLASNWNWKERLFLLPGNSAKATVQAAIGAIPLARGIEGGETILAIAALSILVTAPLGAWAIPTFAPKLLERGEVDPTKVGVTRSIILLAAVDTSEVATQVLTKAADIARRGDASVIILHVIQGNNLQEIELLKLTSQSLLADIRHQFVTVTGTIPEEIIKVSQEYQVDDIVIGKRGHKTGEKVIVGSVSQAVLESSLIPVILVEGS